MGLYVILYVGYTIWERFYQKEKEEGYRHFVPLTEVDFESDAVWGPGEGAAIRERDRLEEERIGKEGEDGRGRGPVGNIWGIVVGILNKL